MVVSDVDCNCKSSTDILRWVIHGDDRCWWTAWWTGETRGPDMSDLCRMRLRLQVTGAPLHSFLGVAFHAIWARDVQRSG